MRKAKKIFPIALILALGVGLVAALLLRPPAPPAPDIGQLRVAASFYPLAFFSEQIGGNLTRVVNITPAGAEPHEYEPTAQDIALIEKSRLLILSGAGFEPWAGNIKQNINPTQTLVVNAGEGLADRQIEEAGKKMTDPHIWLSPVLAKNLVSKIAEGFSAVDQANASYYQANAAALTTRLDTLDQAYRQGLAGCRQKNIVTSHAAFGYLAAAYGINQVAIAGLSPDAEPSLQQLTQIAKLAKSANIKYIFFESLVSPKLAETIAEEIDAKTLILNPLEGLTPNEAAQGQDYFTVMAGNLHNLQTALQCPM